MAAGVDPVAIRGVGAMRGGKRVIGGGIGGGYILMPGRGGGGGGSGGGCEAAIAIGLGLILAGT